ncbi:MAG TPA: Gfo/Idh/MocA family oxidoreductase, partial [Opitutaceae bacterium]
MQRRTFVRLAASAAASASILQSQTTAAAEPLKAVIIGHTKRGNFGHAMDVALAHRPDVQVVAVSDPDEAGRAKAQARASAPRAYADYRQLLERERPQLAIVAPRWTDQRHVMVAAALEAGAHVYCEKPFTVTLAEADDLLARATQARRRIAVAHQGRLAPDTLALKRALEAGTLGALLEIRIHGKQDRR